MKFEEPKVSVVPIDLSVATASSDCNEQTTQTGSTETCQGPSAPQNNCSTMVVGGWLRN